MSSRAQNRRIAGILAGLLASLLALILGPGSTSARDAAEPAADPAAQPAEAPTPARTPAPTAVHAPTPLAAAFAAILQDEAARLRALEVRFLAAADASAALAIEREIAALKSGTELRLMGAQAQVARDEGRLEDAARIDAAIAEMAAARARPSSPAPMPVLRQPRGDGDADDGGSR